MHSGSLHRLVVLAAAVVTASPAGRVRYCRLLEEGPSFRGRSADFLTMILFGASLMLLIAPFRCYISPPSPLLPAALSALDSSP